MYFMIRLGLGRIRQLVNGWKKGMSEMTEQTFVRGNEKIARALNDPARAMRVKAIREEMAHTDEIHGATLAAVRKAGSLTQAQIAERLGVTQGAVSQLENKPDMLLSTLRNYLIAVGAEHPRLLVNVDGADIAVAL